MLYWCYSLANRLFWLLVVLLLLLLFRVLVLLQLPSLSYCFVNSVSSRCPNTEPARMSGNREVFDLRFRSDYHE